MKFKEPIIALATPSGKGAIAILRISGDQVIDIAEKVFSSVSGKKLRKQKSHTVHLGYIMDGTRALDKVLVTLFKAPNSYTGEEVVEISCHGSRYVQQEIMQLFLKNGCRSAHAGEFTLRAFLNGKMDLSQAEAVSDLIASENRASHEMALQQMRGGFGNEITRLREELLNFASLIELELDFSQEDVEFADRRQFKELLEKISQVLKRLIDSFALGNVIKNGIPIAIVGEPNVGKSTLLNALLNEERAIVSDIAGTTRDTIEDEITLNGIGFRFIDTAGIRETQDTIESLGIQKTFEKMNQAQMVIYMVDAQNSVKNVDKVLSDIKTTKELYPTKVMITVVNKVDILSEAQRTALQQHLNPSLMLSAKTGMGVEDLTDTLLEFVSTGDLNNDGAIVSNTRHYDALTKALSEIHKVQEGLDSELPGDLLAIDIRQALFHLGEITGQVTTDELLGNIFSNFCIGK